MTAAPSHSSSGTEAAPDIVERLREWPAAYGEVPWSSLYIGAVMKEAADHIDLLRRSNDQRGNDLVTVIAQRDAAERGVAQPPMGRDQIAQIFAYIWHGDVAEWRGFLSKADAFLAYPSPPAALPATEEGYFPTCGRLLEDINKAAHAAGTNAWVREVLKQAHRAIRRSAPIPSTTLGGAAK